MTEASTIGTWDLQSNFAPRSMALLANHGSNHAQQINPFDNNNGIGDHDETLTWTVVYGTERGSLHARTYYANSSSMSRGLNTAGGGGGGGNGGLSMQRPLLAATTSSSSKKQPQHNIPKMLAPIDLPHALYLAGPVVHVIPLSQHLAYLVLVDDMRNSSSNSSNSSNNNNNTTSSSGYAAHVVVSSMMMQSSGPAGLTMMMGYGASAGGAAATANISWTVAPQRLPRMSCASRIGGNSSSSSNNNNNATLVYALGKHLASIRVDVLLDDVLPPQLQQQRRPGSSTSATISSRAKHNPAVAFPSDLQLPSPGVRAGSGGMVIVLEHVVVMAVGHAFYAVEGHAPDGGGGGGGGGSSRHHDHNVTKLLSLPQSSQVHPVVICDLQDQSLQPHWAALFLASGRECAVLDVHYDPHEMARSSPGGAVVTCTKPRHGCVMVASPILAAASCWPWLVTLTSDGLVSLRSPSCLAIALRTIEVGTRPNDFFGVTRCEHDTVVAISHSGQAKILQCLPDTTQDLADRVMKLSIDAFGTQGFPRSELAEALHASFTATSYTGPEPSPLARNLLRQYLEAVLGLTDFESGAAAGWPTEQTPMIKKSAAYEHFGQYSRTAPTRASAAESGAHVRVIPPPVFSSQAPSALICGTALLCLVCSQITPPPHPTLSKQAAKACCASLGVMQPNSLAPAAVAVGEMVADKLLREASQTFRLISNAAPTPARIHRQTQGGVQMELVEAAVWLLRSCGLHERAMETAADRLQGGAGSTSSSSVTTTSSTPGGAGASMKGLWPPVKYEAYVAAHLTELWTAGKDTTCQLVLRSSTTYRLLERNPALGLSVFTALHPRNASEWQALPARDDPLAHPDVAWQVVKLLKTVNPVVVVAAAPDNDNAAGHGGDQTLPLDSGNALAVTYIESAVGIATHRPTDADDFDHLPADDAHEERIANFHDELSFLLLEGVIAERRDDSDESDITTRGQQYRTKLRQFLRWPGCKLRPDTFMNSLPSSFLQEKALVLGRLGRHEDAVRILYKDLQSLPLALEYCDDRHERQQAMQERQKQRQMPYGSDHSLDTLEEDNAYLPLIRVALELSESSAGQPGNNAAAAIQVLALRRGAIDRAAALRLLPTNIPVSAVARPFLIPALVDSSSQVRRLTVVSALLRARYLRLQDELTSAQLKAQAHLHVVPQLKSLQLGDQPLHSTKPFKARVTHSGGGGGGSAYGSMPDVMIVKHFFRQHLVIQAKVTNNTTTMARTLSDITFVVAESSEEAIQPLLQVPIPTLPARRTGSAWCVLSAAPTRMDNAMATLTCELRYTMPSSSSSSTHVVDNLPWQGGGGGGGNSSPMMSPAGLHHQGRTYVEELQDLEVHAAHFS